MKTATLITAAVMAATFGTVSAAQDNDVTTAALAELAQRQAEDARIAKNLETFDMLDFEVFSNQQWDRLHESHAEDIKVHWPDGRVTEGLDVHIEDLKAFFVFAPDTRIETHPVRIGQGEWTGVVGVIEGTFSEPMPIGGDQFIQPTGQSYKLTMATVGHWTDEGVMDEEYLFWDNHAFYKQIGLID
ncbi:ester cyclase [Cognatishimia sp. D5M38]|uniref:SnoaL-like polyketide cyclase n=2 Tax=Rhodobacterales TaxID=204455 RepID=A0A1I4GCY7_9RHOB|nr:MULTISPECIES: ester cyclase [Roseobacteraceae]CRL16219.1 SnoaL-like polyketide cyclase [Phaeobacter italicus]SFH11521.1 SnoaL-like polyketide cyclase [Phaeobacter italicus]SFL27403.1 SnoaL-like polyketide cyclase [Shimia haliotis]